MVLELSPQQLADISAHAEQTYPEECCGLMVGKIRHESDKTYKQICQLFPMSNQWTEDALSDENSATEFDKANTLSASARGASARGASASSSTPAFTKARRYWIDPKDMLQVQKQARERGLNILGIYHSHPDHIAEPSECDRALAWPEYAYTIVSVRKGQAVDVQNWALDSKHQFQSEAITVLPEMLSSDTSPSDTSSSAKDRMPISA